jgi:Uma2 family endonuclease
MVTKITMIPYNRQGKIDYANLEFDPDKPAAEKPEAMEQRQEQSEIYGLLRARFTAFGQRPDVLLDYDTYICYDRRNLNIRICPDVCLVFGVDEQAIRPRRLYLPWEAGKPPDWVLEVASPTTGREDINRKPGVYAHIGVPEYWRFDPSGGRYHGAPMAGNILVGGEYQAVELTTDPDGVLKGYSPVLGLSLAWDEGWPRFYDPSTGTYLENWRETADRAAEAEAQRDAAEDELRRLRELLRRQQSE